MEINNIEKIKEVLEFTEGSFYKFEALVRAKDGDNPITLHYLSKTKKNIHLKTWYIENEASLEEKILEMVNFCRATGARLYLDPNRKDTKKVGTEFAQAIISYSLKHQLDSPKTIYRKYRSVTSSSAVSDTKTILFDIDTKDKRALEAVQNVLKLWGVSFTKLETINGYHVICPLSKHYDEERVYVELYLLSNLAPEEIKSFIEVKPNSLCLVFYGS